MMELPQVITNGDAVFFTWVYQTNSPSYTIYIAMYKYGAEFRCNSCSKPELNADCTVMLGHKYIIRIVCDMINVLKVLLVFMGNV